MIRLTSLEIYKYTFEITERNIKIELYTDLFDELSFTKFTDELEQIFGFSDISPEHLQSKIIGPPIIKTYRKLASEKRQTDGYNMLLMGYFGSSIRDSESFFEVVVGLDEDDIQLIWKQNNSNFITFELHPGIYSIKDNSEVVFTMGDHDGTLQTEYNDISMKTKPVLTRSGGTFGTFKSDEKSFFNTFLDFTPHWDYKPPNAIHVYTSENPINLNRVDKTHIKCDAIDGSVVNGLRQPILSSFVSDKSPGCKVFL